MPPVSILLEFIGLGLILPASILTAGLVFARRLGRRSPWVGSFLVMTGLIVAFATAVFAQGLNPIIPPAATGWRWLPHCLAAVGLALCLLDLIPLTAVRLGAAIVVAGIAADRVIPAWPALGPARGNWDLGLAVASLALFLRSRDAAEQSGSFLFSLVLALTCAAASAVLFLAGLASFSNFASILMVCAVVMAIFTVRDSNTTSVRLAAAFLTMPLTWLLVSGYLNSTSEAPRWSYMLLWLAPFSICPSRNESSRRGIMVKLCMPLMLLAVALVLAGRASSLSWPLE